MSCLRAGFAGAELDTGAAIAIATAQGVQAPVAATLLSDFQAGMLAGRAAKKDAEDKAPP